MIGLVTIDWVVCLLMPISQQPLLPGHWQMLQGADGPLRCWWSPVDDTSPSLGRAVLVLPEVFGVNAWVRSVADRLAGAGVPALAMPLFSRTAPDLELGYDPDALAEGRRHKDRTTVAGILEDVAAAARWLQVQGCSRLTVVGFCFGGHAALLAATLPQVQVSFDFYGAGVCQGRPGGGAPSLELLPQVHGQLTCLCGTADPLIPVGDQKQIEAALTAEDPSGTRLRYEALEGADHGFMCEARSSFSPAASARGWQLLLESVQV
ncbi:possible carboxymethylenebutenolidase [Synechococcus sp. RS9916]|nr:possible carboxymethylenebutenolidase [Synechococcus sp. RS9916]